MTYQCRNCGKSISVTVSQDPVDLSQEQVHYQRDKDKPKPRKPKSVVKKCPHCGTQNTFTI